MKITILMAAFAILTGCATDRPQIHNPSDAIAKTASEIESVATEVQRACGNTEPGGECLPLSPISTADKDALRDRLQDAQDALVLANSALVAHDMADVDSRLKQAEIILLLIRNELARRVQ